MLTYTKRATSAYAVETPSYLVKHGKGNDDGYNDVIQIVERKIQEVIDQILRDEDKDIKKLIKILFVDVDQSCDYETVVENIAEIITTCVFGDLKDMLSDMFS